MPPRTSPTPTATTSTNSSGDSTSNLFAVNGSKELAGVGNFIGRERVRESMVGRYGRGGRRAAGITLHQKTEPVVTVAPDGKSARIREKLLQLNSSRDGDGSYLIGIYENKVVRENGVLEDRQHGSGLHLERQLLHWLGTRGRARCGGSGTCGRARSAGTRASTGQGTGPDSRSTSGSPDQSGHGPGCAAAWRARSAVPGSVYNGLPLQNPVSGRDPPELLPP